MINIVALGRLGLPQKLGLAVAVATLIAAKAFAADGDVAASGGAPDFSGIWEHDGRIVPTIKTLVSPVDMPQGADRTHFRFDLLQPWAADIVRKHLAQLVAQTNEASLNCISSGLPLNWDHPRAVRIFQTPEQIMMLEEGFHDIEFVYMNAKHPADLKPSWIGDSVGHFENGSLIIDTTGFNAKGGVDNVETPRTEKLHVTTRLNLLAGGKYMEAVWTLDDPSVYVRPMTISKYYVRDDQPLGEQICEPETGQHVELLGKDYMASKAQGQTSPIGK